jgi:cytochrome c peroxidase
LPVSAQVSTQVSIQAPPPVIPDDNPQTPEKVELGRRLFYDVRFSVTGDTSCATCHQQARAFSNDRTRSIGATGELHTRNVPSLANVVYRSVLTWFNPTLTRLEEQMLVPMMGNHPIEMGMSEAKLLAVVEADADYRRRFDTVFAGDISVANLARAVAAFERSLISFSSLWDRYRAGDQGAISAEAKRGEALFFSEETNCFRCHPAPHFTDTYQSADLPFAEFGFHDIGLWSDLDRVRAPSLRNVAVTAPYMHDGSSPTLEDVIQIYASGGMGPGQNRKTKSAYIKPLSLNDIEKRALIAFLESLTDEAFLTDPRFADPFAASPSAASPSAR